MKESEEESENPVEEMETESLEPNEFDFDSQALAPVKKYVYLFCISEIHVVD